MDEEVNNIATILVIIQIAKQLLGLNLVYERLLKKFLNWNHLVLRPGKFLIQEIVKVVIVKV